MMPLNIWRKNMKMPLCRHKIDEFHKLFGYGYIVQDWGYKVRVKWILPRTKWKEHTLVKKAIIVIN
jgi:hypothetical protein